MLDPHQTKHLDSLITEATANMTYEYHKDADSIFL